MIKPDFMEASAFVAILEQGGFSKAAGELGLSKPRVSELLRNFEERLGVRLVERTTRSVSPTLAGEALLQRLAPLLADFRGALECTSEEGGTVSGLLRITIAQQAAEMLLETHIFPFLKKYPAIELETSFTGELVDIVEGRFDAGIQFGNFIEKDMIAKKISGKVPVVIVASPDYIEKFGAPLHPQDLLHHSCLCLRRKDGTTYTWYFQGKNGAFRMQIKGRLIANAAVVNVRAAMEGLGLFQCTRTVAEEGLADGRLVTVLDGFAPQSLEGSHLYYPSRRQMRPALKAFVDSFDTRN